MSEASANATRQTADRFETVLDTELAIIRRQRSGGEAPADDSGSAEERARALGLAGLAFSGGGIRSATFNLGFIQGLANHKALHLFDYLSTVSGGGYIGGWLSAYWRRQLGHAAGEDDIRDSQHLLATPPDAAATDGPAAFPSPEARAVRFVRRYANYLTPRLGLSADTLALVSTALRNFAVMQLLLVSLGIAGFAALLWLLVAMRALPWYMPILTELPAGVVDFLDLAQPGRWLMIPAVGLVLLALVLSLRSQRIVRDPHRPTLPNLLALPALVAALMSGILTAVAVIQAADAGMPMAGGDWLVVPAGGYCLAWSGTLLSRRRLRAAIGMVSGAAVFAGVLFLGVDRLTVALQHATPEQVLPLAIAFAPAVAIGAYSMVITVHLGLAGPALSEMQREWWSRAGGQTLAISLAWAAIWAVLLFVPPLLQMGAHWSAAAGGFWGLSTWLASRVASGKGTGDGKGMPSKEIVARVAPWLFVAGLLGLLAWLLVALLPDAWLPEAGEPSVAVILAVFRATLSALDPAETGGVALVAGVLFLAMVALVDLNLFSAHAFYASRLARSFLGASRDERYPNAYTGFDVRDDMRLSELEGQRPIHLFNANLNLTGGQELAWQTRRGASFVFTPQHCGFSTQSSLGAPIGGYRSTARYGGGLSVATAIATCGAAASPNMGFHTTASVAALLTVFNLRLARWCPNPTGDQWAERAPKYWSVGPLFAELSGETDGNGRWLNVSDGGHFENLGLYELVRRRAALIVVTDASADAEYQFDDLAMAVRKISVDFGVRIEIEAEALDAIRPKGNAPAFSDKSWALGRIVYPDSQRHGYLIYVKSALGREASIDVRQYRDAHPAFPHESTADQWFNEDQFEAYRRLGQNIAEELCRNWLAGDADAPARDRIADICEKISIELDQRGC
jgi:hypothetical protein